jgi:ABC-2 type transport system permease protein
MKTVLRIALRDFVATVATRTFVIGLLILPAMIGLVVLTAPLWFTTNKHIQGEIAVVDPTDRVVPELQKLLDPATMAERRKEEARKALDRAPQEVRGLAGRSGRGIEETQGPIFDLKIQKRPPDADIEQEKKWLQAQPKDSPHFALVVIHRDATKPSGPGLEYGTYDMYVPPKTDDSTMSQIQQSLREAIINARIKSQDLDSASIKAILQVPPVRSVTVTQDAQRETVRGLNTMLPAVFGALLLMAVLGGGGQLLSSTVEEKSSRVVEVLLSAVSPMQLMAGKLLGQMAVSLLGMVIYIALGLSTLATFALFGMVDLSLIFYLLIFFVITYLVMGSLMMSVGAAVNDVKEAQTLMMPLTIVFMIPWILWMPISRDPGSTLSLVMSFLPPLNTFAMLLRMTSNFPPPFWQVWLSIAIGVGSAYCAVWFAAKVFRIGILMYGKPPNFATLIRWARAA